MTQPSSENLALELEKAGLPELAAKARADLYHDYLSDEPMPSLLLARHLEEANTAAALALLDRHYNGEFDATVAESDAWAQSADGQAALAELARNAKKPPFE